MTRSGAWTVEELSDEEKRHLELDAGRQSSCQDPADGPMASGFGDDDADTDNDAPGEED